MTKLLKPVYLYIKHKPEIGISYFGRTINDPHSYSGSGSLWLKLLKSYGKEHITEIHGTYTDSKDLEESARKFSLDNDIVKSPKWANLKIETGLHPERVSCIDDTESLIKVSDLTANIRKSLPSTFFNNTTGKVDSIIESKMKQLNISSDTHAVLSTLAKDIRSKPAYTHEEREGLLLGYGEVELVFKNSLPKGKKEVSFRDCIYVDNLIALVRIASTPGKIEVGGEESFAYDLLKKYGLVFSRPMFEAIDKVIGPGKDFWEAVTLNRFIGEQIGLSKGKGSYDYNDRIFD